MKPKQIVQEVAIFAVVFAFAYTWLWMVLR